MPTPELRRSTRRATKLPISRIGWAIVLAVACAIAGTTTVWVAAQVWPLPYSTGRDQQFTAIRAEFAQLTLYPGSSMRTELVRDELFVAPSISRTFSLQTGQCRDAQTFYSAQLPAEGWQPLGPMEDNAGGNDETLVSNYHKHEQGFTLELTVDCYVNQTLAPGYEVGISVQ